MPPEEVEDYGRGCKSEGYAVGQRVEFLAYWRADMQQAGCHAVEEIEDGSDDNEKQGHKIEALKGIVGGYATRNEVAASYGVWEVSLHRDNGGLGLLGLLRFLWLLGLLRLLGNGYTMRAMTVWSPVVGWFIFTVGVQPSGKYTSTREPSFMKPRCSSM